MAVNQAEEEPPLAGGGDGALIAILEDLGRSEGRRCGPEARDGITPASGRERAGKPGCAERRPEE